MNARLYDPALGRFLAPDPVVTDPSSLLDFNRYMYARNNPMLYTDESGESWGTAIGWFIYTLLNYGKGVQDNGGQWNPSKWDNTAFVVGYSNKGGWYGGVSFNGGYSSSNLWANNTGIRMGTTTNGVTDMGYVYYFPKNPEIYTYVVYADGGVFYQKNNKGGRGNFIQEANDFEGVTGLFIKDYHSQFEHVIDKDGFFEYGGAYFEFYFTNKTIDKYTLCKQWVNETINGSVVYDAWDPNPKESKYPFADINGNTLKFSDNPRRWTDYGKNFPANKTYNFKASTFIDSPTGRIMSIYWGYTIHNGISYLHDIKIKFYKVK